MMESLIERMDYQSGKVEYILPTLNVLMCPKEAKAAIISAKFSNMEGDFLAISYNNEYKP